MIRALLIDPGIRVNAVTVIVLLMATPFVLRSNPWILLGLWVIVATTSAVAVVRVRRTVSRRSENPTVLRRRP